MELDREKLDAYIDTVVKSQAPDLQIPPEACLVDGTVDPCAIVIFGATGDLTSRKLAPSLYNLYLTGSLPENFVILGAARSEMSHDQFRERIKDALGDYDLSRWEGFGKALYYQRVLFDSNETFNELALALSVLDKDHGLNGNAIFYFAIPPSLYKSTAVMLGEAGLSNEGKNGTAWRRLVVEKPFGRDLESAVDLNHTIEKHFAEHQVYRIDHYLAKETVQNVLVLRFANSIFEPIWNRRYIESVHISATESLGVENRAHYYEESGVIRDMLQNHLMQLLALTTMEPPARFQANHVRDETCKVFRSLRPFNRDDMGKNLILGQYGAGYIDGKPVPAYRDEPNVNPESLTPTFGMMKVFVENWRWEGVPFYITSGKRLHQKLTQIVIHFKKVPHSMFRGVLG
jgi:glucose-6-phosphate 1-dehydrogenase